MIPVTLKGNLKHEHVLLQVILIYAMPSQVFFFISCGSGDKLLAAWFTLSKQLR